jgi:glycosyltransferase involved in cell wall biosynthesis
MRILFLPLSFVPQSYGGASIAILGPAQELARRGHEVAVLTADLSALRDGKGDVGLAFRDEEWEGIPVRRLIYRLTDTGYPAPWYDTLNPFVEEAIKEYIRFIRPDIVHATCGQHLSASPVRAAVAMKVPTVVTLVGYWYICPLTALLRPDGQLCDGYKRGHECLGCLAPRSRLYKVLRRLPDRVVDASRAVNRRLSWPASASRSLQIVRAVDERNIVLPAALRSANLILAPSRALCQRFIDRGIVDPDCIVYWPHSIDTRLSRAGANKTLSPVLRFGYTGHIMRYKGIDVLLRAFRQLPLDAPAELKVYGSLESNPEYAKELIALAEGDTRIRLLGGYRNSQIGAILSGLDVVVLPSTCVENSPVAIHESLAARTPVIATRIGGIPDLIQHEYNGLLFERGNADDLARQMIRIMDEPGLAAALRAHAAPVRSVEDEVTELVGHYQRLQAGRQAEDGCALK